MDDLTLFNTIRDLIDSRQLAVLCTQKDGHPYASLVAVATTPKLDRIIFMTPVTTRKYDNLTACPNVAFLIDNSENRAEDIYQAAAVTATGAVIDLPDSEQDALKALYLDRHPHLTSFADAATTAMVCVKISRYILVNRFQNVFELKVSP
jgi:nitroimidazol reductase NimA-like FMN-containing flavoprotein (pyridoxamine 5'-phosphate oxidase superfamily)